MIRRWVDRIWNFEGIFVLGVLIVTGYCVGPLLYSILRSLPDQVWIPFNTAYKYCSDIGFYGATSQEYRENFWQFVNPVSERATPMYYDLFRSSAQRLAALLTLFIPDHRWGLIISLCLGVMLQFVLLYVLFFRIGKQRFASMFGAMFVIFACSATIPGYGVSTLIDYLFNFSGYLTLDTLNSHFRYVSLHTAAVLMWLFMLAWSLYDEKRTYLRLTFLSLSFFLVIYAYYAFALYAGMLVVLYWLMIYRSTPARLWLKHAAFFSFLILIASAFTNTFANVIQLLQFSFKSETITQAHLEAIEQKHQFDGQVWQLVFVSLAMLLGSQFYVYKTKVKCRFVTVSAAALFLIYLGGALLGKSFLIYRFQTRGLSSVMSFVLVICSLFVLSKLFEGPFRIWMKGLTIFIFTVVAGFSSFGYVRMARGLDRRDSYRMPVADWSMYEYIQKHLAPNTLVLALDPADNYLLPVYSHIDMAIFDPNFSTEMMAENIDHLLGAMRFLNIPLQTLDELLKNFESYGKSYVCAPAPISTTYVRSFAHHFWSQYLYLAYVKMAYGVRIYDFEKEQFDPEFVKILHQRWASSEVGKWTMPSGSYVLIDKESPLFLKYHLNGGELVYETPTKSLYRLKAASASSE